MNNQLKVLIKKTVVDSILKYSKKNIGKRRSFQILDLIIPKERKIRSIVGGLETSMGRTLWEPLAKEIAIQNGFEVIGENLELPKNLPGSLSQTLQVIIEARENQNDLFNAALSHSTIRNNCQQFINSPIRDFRKAPKGNGVDIWLKKNDINYFFDTKTVQPNVGDFRKFLRQILHWYAYYYSKNPNGKAVAKIVFPYNPYLGDFWKYCKGGGKPLEKGEEAWVENEFWDFLSGFPNTFEMIKESFNELYLEKTLEEKLSEVFNN
jgi:hypothetical protein